MMVYRVMRNRVRPTLVNTSPALGKQRSSLYTPMACIHYMVGRRLRSLQHKCIAAQQYMPFINYMLGPDKSLRKRMHIVRFAVVSWVQSAFKVFLTTNVIHTKPATPTQLRISPSRAALMSILRSPQWYWKESSPI